MSVSLSFLYISDIFYQNGLKFGIMTLQKVQTEARELLRLSYDHFVLVYPDGASSLKLLENCIRIAKQVRTECLEGLNWQKGQNMLGQHRICFHSTEYAWTAQNTLGQHRICLDSTRYALDSTGNAWTAQIPTKYRPDLASIQQYRPIGQIQTISRPGYSLSSKGVQTDL